MRNLLLIAFLSVFSLQVMGQNTVGTWSVKPTVGMAVYTFTGKDTDDEEFQTGLLGGAELQWQCHNQLALSLGMLYVREGSKEVGNFVLSDGSDKVIEESMTSHTKLAYLDIPLMMNYYLSEGLAVKAGLQMGVLLDADVDLSMRGMSVGVDVDPCFRKVDVGLPLGISYEYKNVVVEGRYVFGLTRVSNDKVVEYGDSQITLNNARMSNSGFQLSLGYRFKL